MASRTSLTIVSGLWAAFWCLQLLQAGETQRPPRSPLAWAAAAALLPATVATFGLSLLLLFAHVRPLGRANAAAAGAAPAGRAGGARLRFLGRLVWATLAATAAALLAGAVLVADGQLGGADDVGWLNTP